jgi:hypothetical protein
MIDYLDRLPKLFFDGVYQVTQNIAKGLATIPDGCAEIILKFTEKECPHCYHSDLKWQRHVCPVVDTETKRYPEYLYSEVWGLEGYEEAHPKELSPLEMMLENLTLMTNLTGLRVEEVSKYTRKQISAIEEKSK